MSRERNATPGHRIEYLIWVFLAAILRHLPRRAVVKFADALGWLLCRVFRLRRKLVDRQLEQVFGEKRSARERASIALRSYQNSVLTGFEVLSPGAGFGSVLELFAGEPEGLDYVEPLKGAPAIVVTGHLGNWEAMAFWIGPHGIRMVGIAKPLHNPLIQARMVTERLKYPGMELVLVASSMKAVVDATRAGKWVGVVADQDARRHGEFVDFFGMPASTAPGAALFSYKLGIPILPVFCVREVAGLRRLRILVCPPLFPDTSAPKEDEILRLTQAHTKALEEIVAEYPQDYFWLHNRWKTKPKQV